MASVKVSQVRAVLEAFADIYSNVGAVDQSEALLKLSGAIAGADKRTVEELVNMLPTNGQQTDSSSKLPFSH